MPNNITIDKKMNVLWCHKVLSGRRQRRRQNVTALAYASEDDKLKRAQRIATVKFCISGRNKQN